MMVMPHPAPGTGRTQVFRPSMQLPKQTAAEAACQPGRRGGRGARWQIVGGRSRRRLRGGARHWAVAVGGCTRGYLKEIEGTHRCEKEQGLLFIQLRAVWWTLDGVWIRQ